MLVSVTDITLHAKLGRLANARKSEKTHVFNSTSRRIEKTGR